MKYPKRIFDIFDNFEENPGTIGKMVLSEKINKDWIKYNTNQYKEFSYKLASAFLELGIQKGDKIATITNNRPQWNFVDMAILLAGAVHVTVYPTISDEEFSYILDHSDTKFVFVANKPLYKKISEICTNIPKIEKIFTFEVVENTKNWQDLVKIGEDNYSKHIATIENFRATIDENELATMIYTSGTTGVPKGVMLSHKNILHVSIESSKIMNINYRHKALDFLPLSHVFAHMTNYIYQILGISIYYAENIAKVADNIHELQVDGFITVPRLLEAIYEKIEMKAKKLPFLKRRIYEFAVKLAEKYEPYAPTNAVYRAQYRIANRLVFSQWRKALSPNVKFLGCGGSALSPRLARLFWAAGFRVFEGYGLTETSPIIAVNYDQKGKIKIGTVGPILGGVEVKFDNDGEILAKGPNVMLGYYKNPEATAEVITEDGWFKTGDIGRMENGCLKITDRKKEIFKLSSGKYIAPQKIENHLKESFLINQAVVMGENEKFPIALISPNFEFFQDWADKEKIEIKDKSELVDLPPIKDKIQKEIDKINRQLGEHEKIRKFSLLKEELTIAAGELSNTLKLKRKVIFEKYKHLVDELYKKDKDKEN